MNLRQCKLVLIDTWWNVNTNITSDIARRCKVLIDTWWNVNINNYDSHTKSTSFNRYMVECESHQINIILNAERSFNRYMVECESNSVSIAVLVVTPVLIDTWWNVNRG